MALLEVCGVSLALDGHHILDRMSLQVERGTVHALVGPNGAGKSTLAYCLMGLPGYSPASGRIVFDGEDIGGLTIDERARRGLSLAWQEPARFEGITVRRFLECAAAGEGEAALSRALRAVAMDPDVYLDRMLDPSLSGGERKRIELASILVMEPRLMIADEPDSGIDVEALRCMLALFDTLRGRDTTVLIVTHSAEVLEHADAATLMCSGRAVEQGPADRIRRYFADRCMPCPSHNPIEHGER